MRDEKKYTERDLVLAKREGYEAGAMVFGAAQPERELYRRSAAQQYPLPKVTRPRVLADPDPQYDQKWRCVDGVLQYGWPNSDYWTAREATSTSGCCRPTDARIRLWSELLANPTEEVEADE